MKNAMFKWLFLLLILSFSSGLFGFAGGDGSSGDPYQVSNATELNDVRNYLSSYFLQTADIDLGVSPWIDGAGWVPIGVDWDNNFSGTFDGQNYTISNLYINNANEKSGLFGTTDHTVISNIFLENVDITSGRYSGSLLGNGYYCTITNCHTLGSISSNGNMSGGLVGVNSGTISNCSSACNVVGTFEIGGFVGANFGDINNSFSTGNATSTSTVVGGFIGAMCEGNISNCYSLGNSTSDNDYCGGFIGRVDASTSVSIVNCYSTGFVIGTASVGGFIGENQEMMGTVYITDCFWDTETSGQATSAGGTGKTTSEMQTQSIFTNWDFTTPIWNINSTVNSGYPYLEWQGYGPFVTTQPVSDITTTTATGNGTITDLGISNPTAYGVCWSIAPSPTISDSFTNEGTADSLGTFTSSITSLSPHTTYYVRAYAISIADTVYGGEVDFTTLPLDPYIILINLPISFSEITTNFNSIDVGTYSAPTFTDFDGDGLLDMLVGELDGNINHYEQDAINSTSFTLVTATFNSIDVGDFSKPTFTDLNSDGLLDMLVGETSGNINHYEQDSINSTSFTLVTATFNSINVGSISFPTFTDLDGDGLLDMLIGEYDGNINHYEQDAINSTSFTLVTETFDSIDVGGYSSPTFTDLDSDGLLDMLVGEQYGNINHYEQDTINSTSFTLVTETFSSIDVDTYSAPTFIDLDSDGLLDMLIGEYDGNINHYEQSFQEAFNFEDTYIGSISKDKYLANATNLTSDLTIDCSIGFKVSLSEDTGYAQSMNITPVNGTVSDTIYVVFEPDSAYNYTGNITHTSTDAETRDIIVSGTGILPSDVITLFDFPFFSEITTNFNLIDVGTYSAPTFTDLDGDGLLDMLVGEREGNIHHYEQDAINSTSFTLVTETFNSIDVDGYSLTPTFTDLDSNGLLDMLVGELNGNINHYEQDAVNSTLFILVTETFNSIDVGMYSAPTFTDLDGDGLLDMLVGEFSGNINHYEQDAINSTSFTLVTETFNSIRWSNYSTPTFTDLDGDGLLDMFIGQNGGNINHYEQDAINSTSFQLIASSFNSINVDSHSTPTFTDLDSDGLLDMLIGEYDGNINHYEQSYQEAFNFEDTYIGSISKDKYFAQATNLTSDLTIDCPIGFKVSLSEDTGYVQSMNITPVNGTVSDIIYVVFEPDSANNYTGNITHTSTGAETKNIIVTGTGIFLAPDNVSVEISDPNLILTWDAVPGATGYKVYSSDDPYNGFIEEAIAPTGETWSIVYTESKKFYYVVSVYEAKLSEIKKKIKVNQANLIKR